VHDKEKLIHGRVLRYAYHTFDLRVPCTSYKDGLGFLALFISAWFRFGIKVIISILRKDKCRIQMPDNNKINEYKALINSKHPVLKDCFCVCDGLKIPIQSTKGYWKQGKYYNGWKHGYYITNLFVFAPDGMIIFAIINTLGSVHDSTLSDWGNFIRH
jgi:DDE superfamily endonuclease